MKEFFDYFEIYLTFGTLASVGIISFVSLVVKGKRRNEQLSEELEQFVQNYPEWISMLIPPLLEKNKKECGQTLKRIVDMVDATTLKSTLSCLTKNQKESWKNALELKAKKLTDIMPLLVKVLCSEQSKDSLITLREIIRLGHTGLSDYIRENQEIRKLVIDFFNSEAIALYGQKESRFVNDLLIREMTNFYADKKETSKRKRVAKTLLTELTKSKGNKSHITIENKIFNMICKSKIDQEDNIYRLLYHNKKMLEIYDFCGRRLPKSLVFMLSPEIITQAISALGKEFAKDLLLSLPLDFSVRFSNQFIMGKGKDSLEFIGLLKKENQLNENSEANGSDEKIWQIFSTQVISNIKNHINGEKLFELAIDKWITQHLIVEKMDESSKTSLNGVHYSQLFNL